MVKSLYVDSELLKKKIKDSGVKTAHISETLGFSRQGFYKKLNGITPFRAAEVYVLCDLLSINDEDKIKIFSPKSN